MCQRECLWEGKSAKIGSIIMAPVQMAITLSVAIQMAITLSVAMQPFHEYSDLPVCDNA